MAKGYPMRGGNYNVLTLPAQIANFAAKPGLAAIDVQCELRDDPQRKAVYAVYKAGGVPRHPYDGVRVPMTIVPGFPLANFPVGTIVKLLEDGTPTDYIIIHQGLPSDMYDASCSGTWLLRKDVFENRQWHSSDVNNYANSTIKEYLDSTFLARFESSIQSVIKQVKIPYRPGSGTSQTVNSGASGLSCKVFLLSDREVGYTQINVNQNIANDGALLSYFRNGNGDRGTTDGNLRIAYLNGRANYWWLRSPLTSDSTYAWFVQSNGVASGYYCSNSYGVRPAIILPLDTRLDPMPNPDGSFNLIL